MENHLCEWTPGSLVVELEAVWETRGCNLCGTQQARRHLRVRPGEEIWADREVALARHEAHMRMLDHA